MPQRFTPLVAEEHYHLYNRGNNRLPVFFQRTNYLFFLRRLRKYLVGETQTSEVSETSEVSTCVTQVLPSGFLERPIPRGVATIQDHTLQSRARALSRESCAHGPVPKSPLRSTGRQRCRRCSRPCCTS